MIELVVVIVIIAVLSGMAIPQMAGAWGSANLKTSARELLVAARYAQSYAATRQVRSRLVITQKDGQYRLEAERVGEPAAEAGAPAPSGFAPLSGPEARPRTLGRGVRFEAVRVQPRSDRAALGEGAPSAVAFEPTGEADAAVILLTDDPGRAYWTLRIAPSTGRADLREGRHEQPIDDRHDLDQ